MGNGEHSEAECWRLTKKFHDALSDLYGAQQLSGWKAGEHAKALFSIELFVHELAMALTGRRIEFVDDKNDCCNATVCCKK